MFCKEGREKGEKRACVMRWFKWKREILFEVIGRIRTVVLSVGGLGFFIG